MARPTAPQQQPVNPLGSPSVIGLEGGRELARRQQRRRRIGDKITSSASGILVLAVLAAGAWIGYTIYDEQQARDRIETERRQAEFNRLGSGDDLRDAIDELEGSPIWNGPGNPTFGVGEEP